MLDEYRLGNFVHQIGIPFQIDRKKMIEMLNDKYRVNPIPLTKEWARLLNFNETGDHRYTIGDLNELHNYELTIIYVDGVGFCYEDVLHPIEFVHTLQNIYQAKNKKELPIV